MLDENAWWSAAVESTVTTTRTAAIRSGSARESRRHSPALDSDMIVSGYPLLQAVAHDCVRLPSVAQAVAHAIRGRGRTSEDHPVIAVQPFTVVLYFIHSYHNTNACFYPYKHLGTTLVFSSIYVYCVRTNKCSNNTHRSQPTPPPTHIPYQR